MPIFSAKYCCRLVIDIAILVLILGAVFLVKTLWTPYERGMFCVDPSISYPYKKDETVSDVILLAYGVALPLITMLLVEYVRAKREPLEKNCLDQKSFYAIWLERFHGVAGSFLLGCAVSQLFTSVAKHSLGVLRPDFIDVCQPDWEKMNCSSPANHYIQKVPCTTEDLDTLKDAKLSFPSGHASFSTFTMLYMVFYLQSRVGFKAYPLVRPSIQFSLLLLNTFTCLTRISDFKHHWTDVIVGSLLGLFIAVFVVFFVSDEFSEKKNKVVKDQALMLQEFRETRTDHNNLGHNH